MNGRGVLGGRNGVGRGFFFLNFVFSLSECVERVEVWYGSEWKSLQGVEKWTLRREGKGNCRDNYLARSLYTFWNRSRWWLFCFFFVFRLFFSVAWERER